MWYQKNRRLRDSPYDYCIPEVDDNDLKFTMHQCNFWVGLIFQKSVQSRLNRSVAFCGGLSGNRTDSESLVRFLEMYRGDYRIHNFESMHSDILRTIKDMCIFPLFVGIRC